MPYPDRYLLFIEYFNTAKYMSAQSTLDEIWVKDESQQKDFYGGLIQCAVSLYHATNDNARGGAKIYEKAKAMLLPFGDQKDGLNLAKLLSDMDRFYEETDEDMSDLENMQRVPSIEFTDHE
jgi:predicted metal-dependent hydrolase